MKIKPDRSCDTRSESGSIAYIWDCYEGNHVVIYQNQAGLYSSSAQKEITNCGVLTEIEKLRKFFPAPAGVCWKPAPPYQSADRFISSSIREIKDTEIKECEYLGKYKLHGDNPEDAHRSLLEEMRLSYANTFTDLKSIKDVRWYETMYWAEAKAYFCPK